MFLYPMETYLVMRKNEIVSFAGKCVELKIMILSEIRECHRQVSHIFSHQKKLEATKHNKNQGHESKRETIIEVEVGGKTGKEKGDKSNRGSEYDCSTLYASIEIS
jgi:hypothetical protein